MRFIRGSPKGAAETALLAQIGAERPKRDPIKLGYAWDSKYAPPWMCGTTCVPMTSNCTCGGGDSGCHTHRCW
jgi:hypothetical protein